MEEKITQSRNDALEEMISRAQNMPGLIDLMEVYGRLDELILKSEEYLSFYSESSYVEKQESPTD